MNWNTLEKRLGFLTFPALFRGITIIHLIMFIALFIKQDTPDFVDVFAFDWEKIKSGELWRTFSYTFLPAVRPGGSLALIFILFSVIIGFMMNDAIETEWGAFKTSLYIYGLILCQGFALLLLAFINPELAKILSIEGSIGLYTSIFFAFAILFPHFKFLLFFILPVPVWILASLTAAMLLITSLSNPHIALYNLICLLPLLVWALPYLYKTTTGNATAKIRHNKFTADTCGRTDQSDPSLTFRVTEDGNEYCEDHLPSTKS